MPIRRLIPSGSFDPVVLFALPFAVVPWGLALRGADAPAVTARRPRIWFTDERIDALKRRADADGAVREATRRALERADRSLEEELVSKEFAESGRGQHGNYGRPSGQAVRLALALGPAYRLTRDARYARALRDALLRFATFERWAGDAGHDPPWRSELNTARFCFAYAVGYDCLHDFLSEEERATIARAAVELGIRPTLEDWLFPATRIHALDSMGHNWWSVCVAMAGLASLSLAGDVPEAAGWAAEVSEAFPEWFAYEGNVLQHKTRNFDRDGAFYESVGYAEYALSEYLRFRLAESDAWTGRAPPSIPILERTGDLFVSTCYPTSTSLLSVNFGDSGLRSNGARTVHLLLASGLERPGYRWYLGRAGHRDDDPLALVFPAEPLPPTPPPDLPLAVCYEDIGWAAMRSSWSDDATLLAVKSGFAWNHAHPDAGSFVLFHGGRPLIIDSGTCSYSRREYTTYYRHARAHNVVLADGEAEPPEHCGHGDRGTPVPGTLQRLIATPELRYLLADATGPTSWRFDRNYRHFLWVADTILVIDDVRTHEPAALEWLLHHEGSCRREGSVLHLAAGDAARATVHLLHPEEPVFTEKTGLADHEPETEVTYTSVSPAERTRVAQFVAAIVPAGTGPEPRLERLTAPNALGVRILGESTVTDVYLNLLADGRRMHRNSCATIEGWETDAALIALTRPRSADVGDIDAVSSWFVACGSYLRRGGDVMLHSLSKVYAAVRPEGGSLRVELRGQPIVRASLRARTPPVRVLLNGREVAPDHDPKAALVRVSIAADAE